MPSLALLISVRPRFAEMIFSGTKTVELRRLRPRIETGDLVFVYVSSPVMALTGAFEVGGVIADSPVAIWRKFNGKMGLEKEEFNRYYHGRQTAFAILVGRSWLLPVPVHLTRLRKERGGFHPPQSYQYICRQDFSRMVGMEIALHRR